MKKFMIFLAAFLLLACAPFFAASSEIDATDQPQPEDSISTTASETEGVREEYLAEQKVKALPSNHGGTIDAYLTNMSKIPVAEDLGWQVNRDEGGYEVMRSILIQKKETFEYKWQVSDSGEINPVNDRAKKLMK